MVSMGRSYDLKAEIGKEHNRGGLTQAKGKPVQDVQVMCTDPVPDEPGYKRTFHDHHGDARKDAGDKEEYRNKRGVPQWMQLSRGEEKQGTKCGLVEGG